MNKFEELLKKYEKTVDDITFTYEGLSDEELEAAFAKAFNTDPAGDPAPTEPEKFVKSFELSHSDIRCALYNLLNAYEEADNDWYFINSVYDSHLHMRIGMEIKSLDRHIKRWRQCFI